MSSLQKEERVANLNHAVEVQSDSNETLQVSLRIDTHSEIDVETINPVKFLVKVSGDAQIIHIAF